MRSPPAIAQLPLPMRWTVFGALALGALGCAAGLVIGLRVYPPTAWAATFEVGTPAAILGALLGAVAGSLRSFTLRHHDSSRR